MTTAWPDGVLLWKNRVLVLDSAPAWCKDLSNTPAEAALLVRILHGMVRRGIGKESHRLAFMKACEAEGISAREVLFLSD